MKTAGGGDPFVGRQAELAALQEGWQRAQAGVPQFVLIQGEAGMGRTALLHEFLERAAGHGQILRGRCLPVLRAPYGVLASIVVALLGCDEDASPAAIGAALDLHVATMPDATDVSGLVRHLLGLDSPHPASAGLSPSGLQQAALAALGDLLERVAERRPLLVSIEDVHWADAGTAEWIAAWCRRLSIVTAPQRVMLTVSTVKGGMPPPLAELATLCGVGASQFASSTLDLGPLILAEAWELAGLRLEQRPATWSPPLRRLMQAILDRAAGHPAYLVETIAALEATGVLVRDRQAWRVAPDDVAIDLPGRVSDAIASRFQLLPDELRERLGLASVAESRFAAPFLGAAYLEALGESLDELVRLEVLAESGSAGVQSETGHQVAHAERSDDARRRLHREVGEALEALLGPMAARFASELAFHFSAADDAPRTYHYTVLQAERARETGFAAEACRLYGDALVCAGRMDGPPATPAGVPRLAVVRLRHASAQTQVGDFAGALATLAVLAREGPLSPEAWRTRGMALERSGDLPSAHDAMEEACQAAGTDAPEAGRSLLAQADIQRRMGRFAEAIATMRRAKALLGDSATPNEVALLRGLQGVCHFRMGDAMRALVCHRKALAIRQDACDLEGQANSLNNLGIVANFLKRFEDAEGCFGRALALFCKLGNRPGAAMVLNNLGELYLRQGRDSFAEARLSEAHALADQLGYTAELVTTGFNLAEVYLLRHNPDEALRRLERCLRLAIRAGLHEFLPEIHAARGRAYRANGDHAEAKMAYHRALELAETAGNMTFAAQMRRELAKIRDLST